jgi:(1->4)-alpha-D-glucan 1-alpha-D-glucosylmutase
MQRIPSSTYRVQLHAGFKFDDAARILPYLKSLGVTHVYCSPYFQAAPGSTHGYDVVDHQAISAELGGEEGHQRFCRRLKELGLGQVLDIVPNHMAIGWWNRYWWDVLENGPSSRYATWFDIDWNSDEAKLQNKVLIPVLGDQYGRVLSAGQIKIEREVDAFRVRYMDSLLPLAPRSLPILLSSAAEYAQNAMMGFLADSLLRLPSPASTEREVIAARHRDKTVIYELLRRLCTEQPEACLAIDRAIEVINSNVDSLDDLLNRQSYRLAFWRTADQELGYRRFFDVNTLIGLRMERAHVFEATHWRVLKWLQDGELDGVRIDHPDGLRDPQQYFERLRARTQDAWIIAEKIIEPGEELREEWPIDGTCGYDFLNICNLLLVNGDGLREMTATYREFTGEPIDFQMVAHDKKLAVQHEVLGSDVNRLASLFVEICENRRDRRDYTRAEIRRSIRELASCFAIYRTYVAAERDRILETDRVEIDGAVARAREQRPDLDPGLLDFLGDVLAMRAKGKLESDFLQRFQQFTSPVMAKGVEDTAFYCFNRMIGLNEVGGDPASNGVSLEQFHEYCARMHKRHPNTMTTISTHDTKRSDDIRARLAVVTEIPGRWRRSLLRWAQMNRRLKVGKHPDPNTEYFLYQTMVGAWPIERDRLVAYMVKATREAKQHTNWLQPDEEFEQGLRAFIDRILDSDEFVSELQRFVEQIIGAGRINSLAQTLIKCTAPGVPDTYQGSELWDLRLVDPDNRGPVDFVARESMLSELRGEMEIDEVIKRMDTGMPKLWLITCALNLRTQHPDWFGANATYAPLIAEGSKREHLAAYLRGERVVAIAPRWPLKLGGGWAGTTVELPGGSWKNLLTKEVLAGGRQRVQRLLARFPVALLVRESE